MKDPEFKKMLGQREADDDGFTYCSGAHKGGFIKKPRHTANINRCRRSDKRKVKAAAIRRELKDLA